MSRSMSLSVPSGENSRRMSATEFMTNSLGNTEKQLLLRSLSILSLRQMAFEESGSLYRKFWAVVMIVCLAGCIFQVTPLILKYLQHPTTIKISLDSRQDLFPAVTVCNLNPYRSSSLGLLPEVQKMVSAYESSAQRLKDSNKAKKRRKRDLSFMCSNMQVSYMDSSTGHCFESMDWATETWDEAFEYCVDYSFLPESRARLAHIIDEEVYSRMPQDSWIGLKRVALPGSDMNNWRWVDYPDLQYNEYISSQKPVHSCILSTHKPGSMSFRNDQNATCARVYNHEILDLPCDTSKNFICEHIPISTNTAGTGTIARSSMANLTCNYIQKDATTSTKTTQKATTLDIKVTTPKFTTAAVTTTNIKTTVWVRTSQPVSTIGLETTNRIESTTSLKTSTSTKLPEVTSMTTDNVLTTTDAVTTDQSSSYATTSQTSSDTTEQTVMASTDVKSTKDPTTTAIVTTSTNWQISTKIASTIISSAGKTSTTEINTAAETTTTQATKSPIITIRTSSTHPETLSAKTSPRIATLSSKLTQAYIDSTLTSSDASSSQFSFSIIPSTKLVLDTKSTTTNVDAKITSSIDQFATTTFESTSSEVKLSSEITTTKASGSTVISSTSTFIETTRRMKTTKLDIKTSSESLSTTITAIASSAEIFLSSEETRTTEKIVTTAMRKTTSTTFITAAMETTTVALTTKPKRSIKYSSTEISVTAIIMSTKTTRKMTTTTISKSRIVTEMSPPSSEIVTSTETTTNINTNTKSPTRTSASTVLLEIQTTRRTTALITSAPKQAKTAKISSIKSFTFSTSKEMRFSTSAPKSVKIQDESTLKSTISDTKYLTYFTQSTTIYSTFTLAISSGIMGDTPVRVETSQLTISNDRTVAGSKNAKVTDSQYKSSVVKSNQATTQIITDNIPRSNLDLTSRKTIINIAQSSFAADKVFNPPFRALRRTNQFPIRSTTTNRYSRTDTQSQAERNSFKTTDTSSLEKENITKVAEVIDTAEETEEDILEAFDLQDNEDLTSIGAQIQSGVPLMMGNVPEWRRSAAGTQKDQFFVDCSYYGKKCDISTDFTQWNDANVGNCFTFNHKENVVHKIHNDKIYIGLRLSLFIDVFEYLSFKDTAGVKIHIHNPYEDVFLDSQGWITPINFLSTFYVTMNTVIRDKSKGCIGMKNVMDSFAYTSNYTVEACLRSMYQSKIVSTCNCSDPRYPVAQKHKHIENCRLADIACVENITLNDINQDNCPMPCMEIYPDVITSQVPTKSDNATQSRNLVKLEIKTAVGGSLIYVESPAYPLVKLFSDVGSTMAYWLGASMLSIIEMTFLLFYFVTNTK